MGQAASRVPAALTGVRPRPIPPPQFGVELLTVWHVVSEEEVVTRGVPLMVIKHSYTKITGGTP